MHIRDILAGEGTKFSVAFFPHKTPEAAETLSRTVAESQRCEPAFVGVTYGAGGITQEATRGLVDRILRETKLNAIPHLTCVGHRRREIEDLVEGYAAAGISNILALRGDPPQNATGIPAADLPFAAEPVAFIRRFSEMHGHDFGIGVAGFPEGHPAMPDRLKARDLLKAKVDAGAVDICAQLF